MSSGMSSQVSSGVRSGVVSIAASCAAEGADEDEGPSLGFSGLLFGGLGGGAEDIVGWEKRESGAGVRGVRGLAPARTRRRDVASRVSVTCVSSALARVRASMRP